MVVLKEILFVVLLQSFIILGAHCAELCTTLARDETAWRGVAGSKGSNATISGFSLTPPAVESWQSFLVMNSKPAAIGLPNSRQHRVHDRLATPVSDCPMGELFDFSFKVSLLEPQGPYSAAYGYPQTTAESVAERSP